MTDDTSFLFLDTPAATSWAPIAATLPSATLLDVSGIDAAALAARLTRGTVLVARGEEATLAALATSLAEPRGTAPARLVLCNATIGTDGAVSRQIGVLLTPTLLVCSRDDPATGPDVQASLVAPHFARARLHVLDAPAPPRPSSLAAFVQDSDDAPAPRPEPPLDPGYAALIASDRVTARTREALLARLAPLAPTPRVLTPPLLALLRAAIAIVFPTAELGEELGAIDIARRIDEALAAGGDGWRPAALPPDAAAMTAGLRTLDGAAFERHGRPFLALDVAARTALLDDAEGGTLGGGMLEAAAMALWFGELKREAVRQWMSHPATLDRLGYSGNASTVHGFERVGLDRTEAWEPRRWA